MSSAFQEFVREIAQHPNEDAPRLVLADWLEERGDVQGEFIRVQIELAALDARDPRRPDLESRELQLVRQHSKGWAGSLRRYAKRWTFRRGLVHWAQINTKTFLGHPTEILQAAPLQDIDFSAPYEHLDELAKSESLGNLRGIGFTQALIGHEGGPRQLPAWDGGGFVTYQEASARALREGIARALPRLERLLMSPHVNDLRSLNLDHNHLRDQGAAMIASMAKLSSLGSLSLRGSQMEADGCEMLAQSPHLQRLRHLYLGSCLNIRHNYSEEWVGPLIRAVKPFLSRLTSLDLGMCGLTLHGIESLADCRCDGLRSLSMASSMLTQHSYLEHSPTFQVLADSPMLKHLDQLDLSSCYFDAEILMTVAGGGALEKLVRLSLNNDGIDGAAARVLGQLEFPYLTHLSVSGSRNRDDYRMKDDATAIFQSDGFPRLASLNLSKQGITSGAIETIADTAVLRQLYRLDLSENEIGTAGADRLASLQPWPRLAELNLRGNRFGNASRDRLIHNYGFRVIV